VNVTANDSSWADALAAVSDADAIVLALGTDQTLAHEGVDLSDIALPAVQQTFAAAVFAAAGSKPVIVVFIGSFPTSFDTVIGPASAIVLAYTPALGTPQIAAALFGVNRWGRAVQTVYPAAYQDAVSFADYSIVPTPVNPGRTYRYYNGSVGAPLVRFGEGLTYSTISVKCTTSGGGNSDALTVTCLVSSTAGPDGDQILQVYHRAPADVIGRIGGSHPVPLSTLVGFQRISLPAGSTVPVDMTLSVAQALSLVDNTGASVLYPGLHFLDVWDGSANNVTLSVEVPGPSALIVKRPPVPSA